jgi:hypothetical protein
MKGFSSATYSGRQTAKTANEINVACLDTAKIDEMIASSPSHAQVEIADVAGRFLLAHGNWEVGKRYLIQAISSSHTTSRSYSLSWKALLDMSLDPNELRSAPSLEPAKKD